MRHIDAGISGGFQSTSPTTWRDLSLPNPWPVVIDLLAPQTAPRAIQLEALGQQRILDSRRNLIVAAPTNSGKSLVGLLVLLSAVRQGRRAVLLEPLRAIAREKADELSLIAKQLGLLLDCKFSVTLSTGDLRLDEEALSSPPPSTGELIIATPERLETILRNPAYSGWISTIDAICVDEAHLLGSLHRGPTLEHLITSFLTMPAPPRVVLLSATLGDATPLQSWLAPCDLVTTSCRQPPLHKAVVALDEAEDASEVTMTLARELLQTQENNLLIFVYQTRSTQLLAERLNQELTSAETPPVLAYHSQMNLQQRQSIQRAFRQGQCRCLVTTTALGLGVNLPASHVIIRDVTFPGAGRLSVADLLQMMGRAGRGDHIGHAQVLVRASDGWQVEELAESLRSEEVTPLISPFARRGRNTWGQKEDKQLPLIATQIAALLSRQHESGLSQEELQGYFPRSWSGAHFTDVIPSALSWLSDLLSVLAYRDESAKFRLTVLGTHTIRTALPLGVGAGLGQLLRDLLTIDPTDRLLRRWHPLDHLIVLFLLHGNFASLRPFSNALVDQVDGWMEQHPEQSSLLYAEWIRGADGYSRSEELLGSLGIAEANQKKDGWARKTAYQAMFSAIVVWERSTGMSPMELERRWKVRNLEGTEERLRDELLWLLSGVGQLLELRSFFYHLKQECQADSERLRRVKQLLHAMVHQIYLLQNSLKYCSPLGHLLYSLRRTSQPNGSPNISHSTVQRLEDAGITSVAALAKFSYDDLRRLGIQGKFAKQILSYVRQRTL